MGNIPAKIDQQNLPTLKKQSRSLSVSSVQNNSSSHKNNKLHMTSPLTANILGLSNRSKSTNHDDSPYRRQSTKSKERMKEKHAENLIVRYDEMVDGGFLAPFSCYKIDKLDYDTDVVKDLIIRRKMAPFYTPLHDFDETWSKSKIINIVNSLPLHADYQHRTEEFEDVPIGDLAIDNFDYLIDDTNSKYEKRKLRSLIFKARLHHKMMLWQEKENKRFLKSRLETENNKKLNKNLLNDDLKFELYSNGLECPICFLYYPAPLNISRCCLQPICTECFVQIRRLEPHFPHDEVDPTCQQPSDEEKDPNLLVSVPANCPYCATYNFGITYNPPVNRRIGLQSDMSSNSLPAKSKIQSQTRRGSLLCTDESVITSDTIRADWEVKLNKERIRLARKSANATAIHLSNQLVDPQHHSRKNSIAGASCNSSKKMTTADYLEEEMVKEALKLSLLEHKYENIAANTGK